jgi:hypothetical protein
MLAIACDNPENYGWAGHIFGTCDMLTETVNKVCEDVAISRSSIVRALTTKGLTPHNVIRLVNGFPLATMILGLNT